jgi:LacI family transcriptional regulator
VPSKDGRATLATVAASAGVSITTVSKVLNGRDDVAPATRALIETLLEEHDYVARRAEPPGRGAVSGHPSVELVFHGPLTAYCTEILRGVLETSTDSGVAVALSLRSKERKTVDRPAAWARDLAAAGRQAVIAVVNYLTDADLTALSRVRPPLVVIDPLTLPQAHLTSVGSTNFAGGLAATQHLLSLGHRRIGYVGGPATAACNQARMRLRSTSPT